MKISVAIKSELYYNTSTLKDKPENTKVMIMAKQGINKATVLGNVGQDPKVSTMPNGDKVALISVATSTTWTDSKNQPQKSTQWHNIVAYKGAATYIEKAIKKGSKVYVEGGMRTNNWVDKNNNQRETLQIVVDTVQVISNGRNSEQQSGTVSQYAQQNQNQKQTQPAQQNQPAAQPQPEPVDDFDDDIPF